MATTLDRAPLELDRFETGRLRLEDDEHRWSLHAREAREAARLRHAFRDYLEAYGDPASDFDAAEAVYGELIGNCAHHAPGEIHIEFRWADSTLVVNDAADRLRHWPFSLHDSSAETTFHAFAIVTALAGGVRVRRAESGTCASVVLPVLRR